MDERLTAMPLFGWLNDDERQRWSAGAAIDHYDRGDMVFRSGDAAEHFYLVLSGRMKIYFLQSDGREQILYIYGRGDFIGGLNLMEDTDFIYNARTLEATSVCRLSRSVFLELMAENARLNREVLRQLWIRLRWAEALVGRLSIADAGARMAKLLLDLIPLYGRETARGLWLPLTLTHDEMGGFTGLSRETVTRQLKRLADDQLIAMERGKGILLLDRQRLRRMVSDV